MHLTVYLGITAMQGGQKKRGYKLMSLLLSNLSRFKEVFTGWFLCKFAVKRILRIPPHLVCVATLSRETLTSAKQAINDKLQGSVATYLRCGGVVNNQIKKVYCSVWVNFFKSVNMSLRTWLLRALCAHGQHTAKRRRKCTRQSRSCL